MEKKTKIDALCYLEMYTPSKVKGTRIYRIIFQSGQFASIPGHLPARRTTFCVELRVSFAKINAC